MCNDERVWEEPASFNPERFLKPECPQLDSDLDPRNIVFGFGRRSVVLANINGVVEAMLNWNRLCPGNLFADTTLFLTIASIVATLDIQKARDAKGVEITPRAGFTDSFVG